MNLFARLYEELDQSTRTTAKVAALQKYFAAAPPADAAWGLHLLIGRRLPRALSSKAITRAALAFSGLPEWLLRECQAAVGDRSETLALVLPPTTHGEPRSLASIVADLQVLAALPEAQQPAALQTLWRVMSAQHRYLMHKLLSRSFRVGVGRTLVVRALAQTAGVAPAVMDHRLLSTWAPTAQDYARLTAVAWSADIAQPFPFFLASALADLAQLGDPADWLAEWKWDGIRAQLLRRAGRTLLWSRGEENITPQFPELVAAAAALPDGVALDGEVIAGAPDAPLPFAALQRRLNRKRVELTFWPDPPIAFVAFDLLERGGCDLRERPLRERRAMLAELLAHAGATLLSASVELPFSDWAQAEALRAAARAHGAEGLMIKHRESPYRAGRPRGDWWKWKVVPYTVDAVLVAAQAGHGRRASLFTDYTFALWDRGALTPVAKAYSGLSDAEILRVDQFVRKHTVGRFGPLRTVEPLLVFELAFEQAQRSTRHKSGVAVRFPRIARWRTDKRPADADQLDALLALIRE